jgi:DNA-binding HxlR family transcriptional regulator
MVRRTQPSTTKGQDSAQCVFDRISEKWTLRILARLVMSPMHFLALQRNVAGISRKMLAETLRHLERDGLVTRRPDPGGPAVEYSLSGLGQSLCGPLEALRQWSQENAEAVEVARRRYDEAATTAPNPDANGASGGSRTT